MAQRRALGPLHRSRDPRKNAPAAAAAIAGAVSIVLTASAGVPGWARGTIAVLIVAGGVGSQFFGRAR